MSQLHTNDEEREKLAKFPRYSFRMLLRTMAVLAFAYILLLAFLRFNRDSDLRRIFGGSAGWSALKGADRVEVYRIGKLAELGSDSLREAKVADFPVIKGPLAVSQADAETLRRTLQDRNSYVWSAAKGCIPAPGVRLDFIRGNDQLSVLLCFECDIVLNYLNGKLVGGEDFDNARPTLVRTVRSLFPDDQKLQSLPEQH